MGTSLEAVMRAISIFICICLGSLGFSQPIKVVTEEYPPYNYTVNYSITGFSTEVVMATMEKAKLGFSISSYPWERAYTMALNDKDTMIYSIRRSPEREQKFKWGSLIVNAQIWLYKLRSRKDIRLSGLEDAKKYTTVVIPEHATTKVLLAKGFELNKNLTPSPAYETNIKMLLAGRIDLWPADELEMFFDADQEKVDPGLLEKTISIPEVPSMMYMAFSLSTSNQIVEKCKAAFDDIVKDGTYSKLETKYGLGN